MPEIKELLFMGMSTITIVASLLTISDRTFLYSTVNALTSPFDNGVVIISNKALPVTLVHGWNDGSWVWSDWQQLLKK